MNKQSEALIQVLSMKQDSLIDIFFETSALEFWYGEIQSCIDDIRFHTKSGDDYELKSSVSRSFALIDEIDLEHSL